MRKRAATPRGGPASDISFSTPTHITGPLRGTGGLHKVHRPPSNNSVIRGTTPVGSKSPPRVRDTVRTAAKRVPSPRNRCQAPQPQPQNGTSNSMLGSKTNATVNINSAASNGNGAAVPPSITSPIDARILTHNSPPQQVPPPAMDTPSVEQRTTRAAPSNATTTPATTTTTNINNLTPLVADLATPVVPKRLETEYDNATDDVTQRPSEPTGLSGRKSLPPPPPALLTDSLIGTCSEKVIPDMKAIPLGFATPESAPGTPADQLSQAPHPDRMSYSLNVKPTSPMHDLSSAPNPPKRNAATDANINSVRSEMMFADEELTSEGYLSEAARRQVKEFAMGSFSYGPTDTDEVVTQASRAEMMKSLMSWSGELNDKLNNRGKAHHHHQEVWSGSEEDEDDERHTWSPGSETEFDYPFDINHPDYNDPADPRINPGPSILRVTSTDSLSCNGASHSRSVTFAAHTESSSF